MIYLHHCEKSVGAQSSTVSVCGLNAPAGVVALCGSARRPFHFALSLSPSFCALSSHTERRALITSSCSPSLASGFTSNAACCGGDEAEAECGETAVGSAQLMPAVRAAVAHNRQAARSLTCSTRAMHTSTTPARVDIDKVKIRENTPSTTTTEVSQCQCQLSTSNQ